MSREFPDILDPWKAAGGRRTFQGTMPLKRMERLLPLLAPDDAGADRGEATFSARFAYDGQGLVTVRLEVIADLPLVCQRSLAPYSERIERKSLLVIIEDVAQQESTPDHYEPVLVEHRRLPLQDIVEEELLLAVPPVPRNPEVAEIELSTDGVVKAPSDAEQEQRHRPFADLAGLMKADAGD